MKNGKAKIKKLGALVVCFMLAFGAIQLMSCSEDENVLGPECGTGNVQWDSKAGVCRDLGRNNTVVPSSCCGR